MVRKNLDGFGVGLMLLLCMIWGLQQVAIKAVAHDLSPLMQVGLRSGLSALLVGAVMVARKERFSLSDGTLAPGLVAGLLFAAEFLFVAKGLTLTTASHMAVFLYTSPIFTALGLQLRLPSERLSAWQWGGIGIAFCGIVTAFAGGLLHGGITPQMLLGDCFGILAGASWGTTTVVIRCSALSDAASSKTLLYQLAVACAALLTYALLTGQFGVSAMTHAAWGSLLFQAIVVSFASYLAWFWLLRRYLASRLSAFSFMTPLFGVSFGVLLLHEPLDGFFAAGAVLVLMGITLVSVSRSTKNALTRPSATLSPKGARV